MKATIKLKAVLFLVIGCMVTSMASAQMGDMKPAKALASPRDSVSGMAGGAKITINYGSPSVKGRAIWGKLVPYNEVWRTGANEATTFTTSKDIMVEGKALKAGKYGFFAIPTETGWTIIFNSVPNQWGAFKYDKKKDVLRVMVKATASPMHERLVYAINSKGFNLAWDKLMVPVMVK